MLSAFLMGLSAGCGAVLFMKVHYTAKATIMISSQQIPKEFVRPTLPEDSFDQVNAMIGEILSRERLSTLIEKYNLYPELRAKKTMSDVAFIMRGDIYVDLERGLPTASQDSSRLLSIEFTETHPNVAADITNELANLFVSENIRLRGQQAKLTTEFLRHELQRSEEALADENREIAEFKEKYRGELPDEEPANLQRLTLLQNQRQSLANQIADGETRVAMITSSPSNQASPDAKLLDARNRLAAELAVHTEAYPDVIALRREIATLEKETTQNGGSGGATSSAALVSAAQRQVAQLRDQLSSTENEQRELGLRIARTPARQEALSKMEEKAKVLSDNYADFLRKVKEAELAETLESAQQGERFSVIESATPPTHPNRSTLRLLAMVLAGSVGFAGMVGLLFELLDPVVLDASQVEFVTDSPMLGSAPRIA
jgi:uncharacterized protein involved in exopolysaccharide biosynthesis